VLLGEHVEERCFAFFVSRLDIADLENGIKSFRLRVSERQCHCLRCFAFYVFRLDFAYLENGLINFRLYVSE
jgi:hypothetical protein